MIGRLKRADAFIAFLDCAEILSSPPERVGRATEWPVMHDVLTSVASKLGKGGDTLPVVLVLSKFDRAVTEDDKERVMLFARNCANSLFEARKNITLLICPVSVLRESGTGYLERNLFNIPTPFLFVSAAIIIRNAAWHAEQADYHRSRAAAVDEKIRQNKESMRGLFRGFFRRIINLGLQAHRRFAIDAATDREVRLEHNDLQFAERAIDYLVDNDNMKYAQLFHRGDEMSISDYVSAQIGHH
ncbi:MAG: hypothetical protein CMJ17_11100 [Phenylobacterium sp.]|nr:hypothetical protein [Phenylobacterium sp.]